MVVDNVNVSWFGEIWILNCEFEIWYGLLLECVLSIVEFGDLFWKLGKLLSWVYEWGRDKFGFWVMLCFNLVI